MLWVVLCAALVPGTPVTARDQTASPPAALAIHPPNVALDPGGDFQGCVVVATHADGGTADVTAQAVLRLEPEGIAAIERPGTTAAAAMVRGLKDGKAVLRAEYAGRSASTPVVVRRIGERRPISFRLDVMPVLMKAGCNSGSCHGSAQGKNGFRLSLFGFEPEKDYVSLTRDLSARRTDVGDPPASLLLRKPAMLAAHEGGQRIAPDSDEYRTLYDWIAARTPDDPPDLPTLVGIEMLPNEVVLRGAGRCQALIVRARYSDGTDRDVTARALYDTTDATTASISPRGVIGSGLPGEAFIMARFGTFAVVTQVIVRAEGRAFSWPEVAAANLIDEAVYAKLRKLEIPPSGPSTDAEFLRRAYLDVVGLLPSADESRAFLADAAADKRSRLIDRLLERPEFPELWAMKWAELLRIEAASNRISFKAMYLYNQWLRDALLTKMPLNQMVRALLTAEGGNFSNPAANYYFVESEPTLIAENVAQVFLGIRIQCAQCHNHPFERWTQDDYYRFGAFFSQLGRKTGEDPRETVLYNSNAGEVVHPRTGQPAVPRFLGGAEPAIPAGGDRRAALADWLTAPDNPYFAAAFVDRVWAHFFGRGLVDPPDDVRVSNPPSHPELRARLARQFVESGYDLRGLVRLICNSRTYQAASTPLPENARDTRNFSHALVRRIPAETLLDAVCQVTGVPEKFTGLPLGSRAVQIADARSGSYFLDVFGRPPRLSACTCERRNEPTLSQALHLINGQTLAAKIAAPGGRLAQAIAAGKTPDAVIDELYFAALCRPPSDPERARLTAVVAESPDRPAALQDVFWALLNSKEFVFNH